MRVLAILRLVRVSSSATAPSDVLAGHALALAVTAQASPTSIASLASVALASMLLYWGGLVLNDWLDRHEDAREQRGRPIPSGEVSVRAAAGLAVATFAIAVFAAFAVGPATGVAALVVIVAIVVYDTIAKRHAVAAAFSMGFCRAANLALGVVLVGPEALVPLVPWIVLYGAYIAALTIVGKSETVDRATRPLRIASGFGAALPVVALASWILATDPDPVDAAIAAIPMLLLTGILAVRRTRFSKDDFSRRDAGLWVRDGVLGITLYNGAFLIGSGDLVTGAVVAAFFPLSLRVSRLFSPS